MLIKYFKNNQIHVEKSKRMDEMHSIGYNDKCLYKNAHFNEEKFMQNICTISKLKSKCNKNFKYLYK